jgi:hypothetical protein
MVTSMNASAAARSTQAGTGSIGECSIVEVALELALELALALTLERAADLDQGGGWQSQR